MNKYSSPCLSRLRPYVPGEQPQQPGLVKLNTNENPYGPSPKAIAAMREQLGEDLRLYPDPDGAALKQSIARYYQIDTSNVFLANGSDEALAHTFFAFFQQDREILFPDITYSFYPSYCALYGIEYKQLPLNENFEIELSEYERPNGGIILANPNAPTGVALSLSSIKQLLHENAESVLVIDEAYIDFGGESAVSLIAQFPNLLVIQTLSKARALAGLRVGLALGDAGLVESLERVKNSFNSYPLDRVALAGAVAAFDDEEYFSDIRDKIVRSRVTLSENLLALGFQVLPSASNFLLAKHETVAAKTLFAALRERNILVRYFDKPRINEYLRISVGTDQQCAGVCSALKEAIQKS